eukprot:1404974-Pleurochrysis_carterae.AAC.1
MEGDKGGGSYGRWYTASRSGAARWKEYVAIRHAKSLPVVGSQALFIKLWAAHKEIKECSALSHPKCDICGKLDAHFERVSGSNDAANIREHKALTEVRASCSTTST